MADLQLKDDNDDDDDNDEDDGGYEGVELFLYTDLSVHALLSNEAQGKL